MLIRGSFRDRVRAGAGAPWGPWRPNLVMFRSLDLVGELLSNAPGLRGIAFLAVGAGEESWDASPPPPDRGRTRLTAEVHRVPLEPGRHLTYDPAAGRLRVRVSIGRGRATGPLREFGLFGGDASARPGTGYLVNHRSHELIEKEPGDTLAREILLSLDPSLLPGARDLIGSLLAGRKGMQGLRYVALGTGDADPTEPARDLEAERYRKALDPRDLRYERATRTVTASAVFGLGEGPAEVREAGLFGGTATDRPGTGFLVARTVSEPVDRTQPRRLQERFTLVLSARTDVEVPALTGKPVDEAHADLEAADLTLGTVTERESDDAPGTVLEQRPAPGSTVNEATMVNVTVAVPPLVTIPPILGIDERSARTVLRRLGLEVPEERRAERPDAARPGSVLASAPPPGARVPRGAEVALTVAVPFQVPVPDLRGQTPAGAAILLAGSGLSLAAPPHAARETGSTVGTIVDQAPRPGDPAPAGAEVRPVLATPWTVEVPDVTTLSAEAAARRLEEAAASLVRKLKLTTSLPGLALGSVSERPADGPEGVVIEQSPGAGERAPLYATVDVVVARRATGRVPDLGGMDQAAAVGALTAAGFAVGRVRTRADPAAPGTVVAQDPAPGRSWPPGGAVSLSLAAGHLVQVPDVLDMALEAAREAVLGRGLVLGSTRTKVADGTPGTVLSQTPAQRTKVAGGSQVRLTLRAGVPNVVGLSLTEATAAIESADLVMATAREEEADGPAGVVIRQDPAPGSSAAPGSRVQVVVSAARRVEAPAVTGVPFDRAAEAARAAGLHLVVTGKRESDQAEGTVLEQDPAAGVRVPTGTAIRVVLAVLPHLVEVPDVIGLEPDAAGNRLAEAGLRLDTAAPRPAPGRAPGSIVEQSPGAGERVARGTVVVVVPASADDTVEVPDARGRPLAEATALLEERSLRLEISGRRPSGEPEGAILDQSPVAGSRAPAGSVVLVVTAIRGIARVPDVVGMPSTAAQEVLTRLGLGMAATTRTDLTVPAGTVLEQDPKGGTTLELGSEVRVVVARRIVLPPLEPGRPVLFPVEPEPPIGPIRPTGPIRGPIGPVGPIVGPSGPVIR